jgi:hypothetical protein
MTLQYNLISLFNIFNCCPKLASDTTFWPKELFSERLKREVQAVASSENQYENPAGITARLLELVCFGNLFIEREAYLIILKNKYGPHRKENT